MYLIDMIYMYLIHMIYIFNNMYKEDFNIYV